MRGRRRRLGQHFLHDQGVAEAIAGALPDEPARVLEVGPGRGALTRPLLQRFPLVRAIEVDEELAGALPGRLGAPPGLEVVQGDALTMDLEDLDSQAPWSVAGNLPYSVATPIIRRFLPRNDLFASLVVMVQLEVAQRLVAPPRDGSRGLLTLEVEAYAEAYLLFVVKPGSFTPHPRVDSAVVRLDLRAPTVSPDLLASALGVASAAFSHRRKKLVNAVASVASPDAARSALDAAGIPPGARPQELPLDAWFALAAHLTTGAA